MTDDTIEVKQEQFEEFMSILDGLCDSLYGNGYDEQVRRLDDLREAMQVDEPTRELQSRGFIQFDSTTAEAFEDLVMETLQQSEFIEVDWNDAKTAVVYEVVEHE